MTISGCKKTLTSCQNDLCFKIMRIRNSVPVTYSMEDSVSNISTYLEAVIQEKDLGFWWTSSLKPSIQCQKVAVKASQVLGIIRRSFKITLASMLVFFSTKCMFILNWNIVFRFGTRSLLRTLTCWKRFRGLPQSVYIVCQICPTRSDWKD